VNSPHIAQGFGSWFKRLCLVVVSVPPPPLTSSPVCCMQEVAKLQASVKALEDAKARDAEVSAASLKQLRDASDSSAKVHPPSSLAPAADCNTHALLPAPVAATPWLPRTLESPPTIVDSSSIPGALHPPPLLHPLTHCCLMGAGSEHHQAAGSGPGDCSGGPEGCHRSRLCSGCQGAIHTRSCAAPFPLRRMLGRASGLSDVCTLCSSSYV
jgi:hypothetical protein